MRHPGLRLTDLNPNCVVFVASDGSGNAFCDSSNLVWIDAQDSLGIGTNAPNASASLELASINQGLLLNRVTTTQRDSISTPSDSLLIYNTTEDHYQYLEGSTWQELHNTEDFQKSATTITYIPGGTSVPRRNIYGSWSEIMTAYSNADSYVEIQFDYSVTNPMSIPAGTHTFSNLVKFKSTLDANGNISPIVQLPTGCKINGLGEIELLILVTAATSGDSPISVTSTSTENFGLFVNNAALANLGVSVPLINVDNATYNIIANNSTLFSSASGICSIDNGTVDVKVYQSSLVGATCFVGSSGTLTIGYDANSNANSQSGFSGNETLNLIDTSEKVNFTISSLSVFSNDADSNLDDWLRKEHRRKSGNYVLLPSNAAGTDKGVQYDDLSTFADIVLDSGQVPGNVNLEIDFVGSDNQGTWVPDAGTHTLGQKVNLFYKKRSPVDRGLLKLESGVYIKNFNETDGPFDMEVTGTHAPWVVDGSGHYLNLRNETFIKATNAPFFELQSGRDLKLNLYNSAGITGSGALEFSSGNTATLVIRGSTLGDGIISGTAGTVNVYYDSSSKLGDLTSSFTGTVNLTRLSTSTNVEFDASNVPFSDDNVQDAIESLGSYTGQGSVLFANSNGEIVSDNVNFFWDDTNNSLILGSNTTADNAILQLESTTKGFLPPRMTETQRDSITATEALVVYNTTQEQLEYYMGKGEVWTPTAYYNPAGFVQFVEEFTSQIGNWTQIFANGGLANTSGTTDHPGVRGMVTGTNSNGKAAIRAGINDAIGLRDGVTMFQWICRTPNLADETDDYIVEIGFLDQYNTTGNQTDSVCFIYDRSTSANWIIQTSSSGTATTTTTSTAVSSSYVKLEAIVNAAGDSVDFFIDGVNVGTHTTNIPATNRTFNLGAMIEKTAGSTSRILSLDLGAWWKWFSTVR